EEFAASRNALKESNERSAQPAQSAQPARFEGPGTATRVGSVARPPARPTVIDNSLADAERALAGGDAAKARRLLSQVLSQNSDNPQVPVRAAVLALRYEQADMAIYLLQPAATRFSDSAAVSRTLGMAQYRKGNYTAAQTALSRALSLDKSNALAYLLMGC